MLTSADLSYIRSTIEKLLPDACNILSMSWTSDGSGGLTETWGTLSASACRIDYLQGHESMSGESLTPYQKVVISLPYDVSVTPTNRIELDGNIFSIQAVNQAQSWQGVTRCAAELIP